MCKSFLNGPLVTCKCSDRPFRDFRKVEKQNSAYVVEKQYITVGNNLRVERIDLLYQISCPSFLLISGTEIELLLTFWMDLRNPLDIECEVVCDRCELLAMRAFA
jgi:hypothetical protein